MQFRALIENQLILANEGKRDKDYLCPECLCPLRWNEKEGISFFSHSQKSPLCTRVRKNFNDLKILHLLHRSFCQKEVVLEKLLPQLGTTADLVWETRKIVFQIAGEHPNADIASKYAKLGFKTVWIANVFDLNQIYQNPKILQLRKQCCYYAKCEIDKVIVFDRAEAFRGAKRVFFGPPLPVDLSHPIFSKKEGILHFKGDLLSRQKKEALSLIEEDKEKRSVKNILSSFLSFCLLKAAN